MTAPPSSIRGRTRPLPVHTFPSDRFLLRSEASLAELATTVTVSLAAKTPNSENFCLTILAVGTTHGHKPPSLLNDRARKTAFRAKAGGNIQIDLPYQYFELKPN
jgi:hypothetical protein